MGTTSEHTAACFSMKATLIDREVHPAGFLSQNKCPLKGTLDLTHLPAVLTFWASVAI